MTSRDKSREASDRIRAAEDRLQRLRDVIERRARLGFDTSEGWRLYRLTANTLTSMRQTESLFEALRKAQGESWQPTHHGPVTVSGVEQVAFAAGERVQSREIENPDCYLIDSGIVSLCFGNADGVEVGMVGPGGIVGLSALLSAEAIPVTPVATTRCRAAPIPLRDLADRIGSDVRGLRFLHTAVARQWADTIVLARCNAEHSVRERVARWVLTGTRHLHEAIGPISHDRLASLLGVRRASVTVALHEIESDGAIFSRRNVIEVRDESALERLSCDCHAHLFAQPAGRLSPPQPHALPAAH